MNYGAEIERINGSIDPARPTDADFLAIAEACRWHSVTTTGDWHAGTEETFPASDPKAHSRFFNNFGTGQIRKAIETYTRGYRGHFEFALEMKRTLAERGHLTPAQAAGMLNVAIADARRRAKRTGDLPAGLAA